MYHGAESAEYWVTVGAQHLQHTTASIMWALKVPNLRYRHEQNIIFAPNSICRRFMQHLRRCFLFLGLLPHVRFADVGL